VREINSSEAVERASLSSDACAVLRTDRPWADQNKLTQVDAVVVTKGAREVRACTPAKSVLPTLRSYGCCDPRVSRAGPRGNPSGNYLAAIGEVLRSLPNMREACDDLPCVDVRNRIGIRYRNTRDVARSNHATHDVANVCDDVATTSVEHDQVVCRREMLPCQAIDAARLPGHARAYQRKRRWADKDELADINLEVAPGRAYEAVCAPTDPVLSTHGCPWH
jgi:hypothetical protein